ncbi:MAG: radical SAM protein [Sulfurimonas sp.]|nr:radical SAM protein [Sulfurimonas sp.]
MQSSLLPYWNLLQSLFLSGRSPGQLIIQYSDACNATCPQCELRVTSRFARSRIDMDDARRMIDAAARQGVQSLSFTGGEPLLYRKELIELIRHAEKAGIPFIRTGTNGSLFIQGNDRNWESRVTRLAEDLASTSLYTFWISIDSSDPQVHESMRGLPGVIRGIEKALPILHGYGIYPAANLGINRNVADNGIRPKIVRAFEPDRFYDSFRNGFARFYEFVENLGFTIVNACYPMSVQTEENRQLTPAYGASSADRIVSFSGREKVQLFRALKDTIPRYRSRLRIFTPLSSLEMLCRFHAGDQEAGFPCRGGIDYFYVDAKTGDTYPCGFRGTENLGKFWDVDLKRMREKPSCRMCDWECFRDPGELLGPLLEGVRSPIHTWRLLRKTEGGWRQWLGDLQYYRACNFFNGRIPPDYDRLSACSPTNGSGNGTAAKQGPEGSRAIAQ